MTAEENQLRLFEALELRSEYDARIKTIRECLPETRETRQRGYLLAGEESVKKPSPGFDLSRARESLRKMEFKRRKLNAAIQEANFAHRIDMQGEGLNLVEALDLRKALNEKIGELHTQVVKSAYQRVIYKEGRDIVEEPALGYVEGEKALDDARLMFRQLNRKLRQASFEILVKYADE